MILYHLHNNEPRKGLVHKTVLDKQNRPVKYYFRTGNYPLYSVRPEATFKTKEEFKKWFNDQIDSL